QARQAEAELGSLQGELAEMDEAVLRDSLQQAVQEHAACEQVLADARINHDNLSASLREADEQRLREEQSLEPLRSRITDLQLKEQAARLAVEQFTNSLEEAGVDRHALQQQLDQAPEDWQRPAWLQAEVQRIDRRIKALGAVNLAALEELDTAHERKTFLDA